MSETLRIVEDLNAFKLSRTLREVAKKAQGERQDGRPTITLPTFLLAAVAAAASASDTSAQVARDLFVERLPSHDFREALVAGGSSASVADELWQAFEGAAALRKRTGGQDEWIGLRHVLFEILTVRSGALAAARDNLLKSLGVDRESAAHRIAKYCWDVREKGEKPESEAAWKEIFSERGVSPGGPPGPPGVALLQPDDPWFGEVNDLGNATAEAQAFAATITARQFTPPLAVGIFGDWGSGKSFFMRLIHKAVDEFANGERGTEAAAEADAGDVTFLKKIVQVRFNAWHYAESNLWASLVEHIFTTLDGWSEERQKKSETDRAFEKLDTARRLTAFAAEELIKRRRERDAATKAAKEASEKVAAREAELLAKPATYLAAAWTSLFGPGDEGVTQRAQLKQAGELLGLGDLTTSGERFRAAAEALDTELAQHLAMRAGILRALTGMAVIILVVLGTLLLPLIVGWLSAQANAGIPPIAAAIGGAAAPLALALQWAAGKTTEAANTIRTYRTNLEAAVTKAARDEQTDLDAKQAELAAAEAAGLEAEKRLETATERVAEAAREYHEHTGKGRLLNFVRERVESGAYRQHLSFIATVRRDFEELNRLMTDEPPPAAAAQAEQRHAAHVAALLEEARKEDLLDDEELRKLEQTAEPPGTEEAVFERIILYIDDLDRCPPQQVVAVLQAIHLLLTFRLFVVFVAVDVRWLRNALAREYEGQIRSDDEDAAIASAGDYLEKIFQVPFWVRPLGETGTRAILESRMGPGDAGADGARISAPAPAPPLHPGAAEEEGTPAADEEAGVGEDPAALAHRKPSLRLTADERAFIKAIAAALDGSPRRTLRFINTYRIVKATFPASEIEKLEGGGFRAFATLLAIAVSADELYPTVARILSDKAADGIAAVLKEPAIAKSLQRKSIEAAFACFRAAGEQPRALKDYSDLLARFSFHPPNALRKLPIAVKRTQPASRDVQASAGGSA